MAIATGTALLASAALSGGLQLAGAAKASSSANKAADQQVASADKGLALQKQIYNEQKAGMQPYAQFGQQALGSLGSLMGFPALPPPTPPTGYGANGQSLGPITGNQGPMNMSDPRVHRLAKGGSLVDPGMSGTIGGMVGQSSYRSPASGLGAPMQQTQGGGGSFAAPGGRMVKVSSPDGEIRDVPEGMVPQLEAIGGRRVG